MLTTRGRIYKMEAQQEILYKAQVLTSHGSNLTDEERKIALSELAPDEVVIRTRAAGVCHTDLHFWHGNYQIGRSKDQVVTFSERGITLPKVLGHEIAGEVFALGAIAQKESGLVTGDRVLVFPWLGCGKCNVCYGGDPINCPVAIGDLGFNRDGGYSEYVRVPNYHYTQRIPTSVSYEVAAMLPCSILTAYSAVKKIHATIEKTQAWKMDAVVGVIGLGGLGQWALKLLKCVYKGVPMCVVGMDISEAKTEHVLKQGLVQTTFVPSIGESPEEQAKSFSAKFNNQTLNCVIDFVNTTDTFQFAAHLLEKCGTLVCVGLHGGLGEIQLPFLVLKSLTIAGVYTGSLTSLGELLEIVTTHSLDPPTLTCYPLNEATQALRDLHAGKVMGRAVLTFES